MTLFKGNERDQSREQAVVRMDERTFRQTGTISIQSPFTLVILDGQPGAAKL